MHKCSRRRKMKFGYCLILLIFLKLLSSVSYVTGTRISIQDNAYSDILIAISPDVSKDEATTIISNIQTMVRGASTLLFSATEKRAYFKEVRILVPDSWDNIQTNANVTWETFNTADVRIQPPNSVYGDKPYTIQPGGCGEPGEYIHFSINYMATTNTINNQNLYGSPSKMFVHQWAHLRYGVLDEYGDSSEYPLYPLFYQSRGSGGKVLPNLCSDSEPQYTAVDGSTNGRCQIDPNTGVYDEKCVFFLEPSFKPKSSLMSDLLTIDTTVEFCRDRNSGSFIHVSDAPNKHNNLCTARSVWNVISSSPDFANDMNPPVIGEVATQPTFKILRSEKGSRYVLVSDVSGSMVDFDRITRLYESARRWIKYDIPDGSRLGLVEFQTTSKITSQLELIDGDSKRDLLITKLPKNAVGGTCIGCGLLSALEVLKESGKGGVILLLTDGEENERPSIYEVLPEIISAEVRVVSIAFGRSAEDLIEDLATQTGGISFFVDDDDTSLGLNDAFTGSLTFQPAVPSDQISVLLFQDQYQKTTQPIFNTFIVDDTVGRNFEFRIDYTSRSYIRSLTLNAADGTIYDINTDFIDDQQSKTALFKLDLAEAGAWDFNLLLSNSAVDSVAIIVTANSRSTTTVPITTECTVLGGGSVPNAVTDPPVIVAKVLQGSTPVVGVNVKAIIEVPDKAKEEIELYDNGVPADITKNDGIYSRYFISSTLAGRYTVYCKVWNNGTGFVQQFDYRSGKYVKEMTGQLSRTASGGSFRVDIPLPAGGTYPPSRVVDLVANNVERQNRTLSLQFTAPGGNLDQKTAESYELKYSTEFEDLLPENFEFGNAILVNETTNIIDGPFVPASAGNDQIVYITLPDMDVESTYYFALRAINQNGQTSVPSNIAPLRFPEVQKGLSAGAIVGIVLGCLAFIILILVGVYFARKKYFKEERKNSVEIGEVSKNDKGENSKDIELSKKKVEDSINNVAEERDDGKNKKTMVIVNKEGEEK